MEKTASTPGAYVRRPLANGEVFDEDGEGSLTRDHAPAGRSSWKTCAGALARFPRMRRNTMLDPLRRVKRAWNVCEQGFLALAPLSYSLHPVALTLP